MGSGQDKPVGQASTCSATVPVGLEVGGAKASGRGPEAPGSVGVTPKAGQSGLGGYWGKGGLPFHCTLGRGEPVQGGADAEPGPRRSGGLLLPAGHFQKSLIRSTPLAAGTVPLAAHARPPLSHSPPGSKGPTAPCPLPSTGLRQVPPCAPTHAAVPHVCVLPF